MYWAVTELGACAGIEVTTSHNPIDYNGMKLVKSGSRPLDDAGDFHVIKALASSQEWVNVVEVRRELDLSIKARRAYVDRVLSFADVKLLRPLKIVANSGNGAAGPTFDAIEDRLQVLGAPLKFIRVHHTPNATFPNGIPSPLLPENHAVTANVVTAEAANFGVAFDDDFDRCFFFDEAGQFVPGEYVVGLLATIFLEKEVGAEIVHDPRIIWNTQDIVVQKGGVAVQSKTSRAFIKQTMH
jgi:phosphomannomutase